MSGMKLWLILGVIGIVLGGPALAGRILDRGNTPGLGWGQGGSGGGSSSQSAPAPVAGLGLPLLAAAGAYVWVVRRNRRSKPQVKRNRD